MGCLTGERLQNFSHKDVRLEQLSKRGDFHVLIVAVTYFFALHMTVDFLPAVVYQ